MSTLWKSNKVEHRAQQAITRLLKARNKNGWPVSIQNHIDFYGLCGCAKPDKLDFVMVMEVLSKMKEKGLSSVSQFEQTFNDLTHAAKTQKKYQWTSFIPLRLEWLDDLNIGQITLFGTTFKFHLSNYAEKTIGKDNFKDILRDLRISTKWQIKDLPNCWLTCKTSNVDFIQSWKDIGYSLYAIRSLIELSTCGFTFKHSWPFQPRFSLPFPLYIICISDVGHRDFYYFPKLYEESKEKPFKISSKAWTWVKDNARKLKSPLKDNSIELLIANALRLYSQSLDDIASNLCLLSLWQMAETITLSQNFGGQTEKVCNRLALFGKMLKGVDSLILKDALSVISHNRNEIVHSGRDSDVDQRMIHILQMTCTLGLLWLLGHEKNLKTIDHLELYYQYNSQNNANIQSLKEVIRFIEKTRK